MSRFKNATSKPVYDSVRTYLRHGTYRLRVLETSVFVGPMTSKNLAGKTCFSMKAEVVDVLDAPEEFSLVYPKYNKEISSGRAHRKGEVVSFFAKEYMAGDGAWTKDAVRFSRAVFGPGAEEEMTDLDFACFTGGSAEDILEEFSDEEIRYAGIDPQDLRERGEAALSDYRPIGDTLIARAVFCASKRSQFPRTVVDFQIDPDAITEE